MDYLRFILKNAARNRRRTLLTVASMGVSLFLLVSLRTLLSEFEFNSIITPEFARRLITRHAVSHFISLPLAHRQRIAQVPGVEMVTPLQFSFGYYQDPKNFFAQGGGDPDITVRLLADYTFNPAEVEAFKNDRTGALVSAKLMERFGWKLGDRLTIISRFFPFNLELVIHGTFTGPDQNTVFFHYDYFNELMHQHFPLLVDRVGSFMLRARTAEDVPRVAAAIDEMFRNSDAPTKTETHTAFALNFTSLLGNVKLFLGLIAVAVVFAILLVTLNTMAMTVRERRGEIAVLKTLGFRRSQVLGLLVGEAVLIALAGGVLGIGGAKLVFTVLSTYKLTHGIIQHFNISGGTMTLGLMLAVLVGVVSATVPAWRAVNGSIAQALREVG